MDSLGTKHFLLEGLDCERMPCQLGRELINKRGMDRGQKVKAGTESPQDSPRMATKLFRSKSIHNPKLRRRIPRIWSKKIGKKNGSKSGTTEIFLSMSIIPGRHIEMGLIYSPSPAITYKKHEVEDEKEVFCDAETSFVAHGVFLWRAERCN